MKKGFTLAELLGVIIVLALISLIAIPAITTSLNKHKKNLCDTQVSYIIASAKNWGADHLLQLPNEGETLTITLSELIKQGYIEGDKNATSEEDKLKIINSNTGEYFSPDPTIIITKSGKSYTYTMDGVTSNSCKGDNTSYKVTLLGVHTNIEGGQSMTNQIINGSFENEGTGWSTTRTDVPANTIGLPNGNRYITTERVASGTHSFYFSSPTWVYQRLTVDKGDLIYLGGKFITELGGILTISVTDKSANSIISKISANIGSLERPYSTFTLISRVYKIKSSEPGYFQLGMSKNVTNKGYIYTDDIIAVNLTQTFGAGNEPSNGEMDALGWFDGTVQVASKSDMNQVDFNVSAEEGYSISNRITCNSGYTSFDNGVLSIKGMNQDTVCRIESIQ